MKALLVIAVSVLAMLIVSSSAWASVRPNPIREYGKQYIIKPNPIREYRAGGYFHAQ